MALAEKCDTCSEPTNYGTIKSVLSGLKKLLSYRDALNRIDYKNIIPEAHYDKQTAEYLEHKLGMLADINGGVIAPKINVNYDDKGSVELREKALMKLAVAVFQDISDISENIRSATGEIDSKCEHDPNSIRSTYVRNLLLNRSRKIYEDVTDMGMNIFKNYMEKGAAEEAAKQKSPDDRNGIRDVKYQHMYS